MPVVLIRGIGALIDPHSCCENGEGKDAMALVRDVGRKFRKKPDTSNRVPIMLGEPVKSGGAAHNLDMIAPRSWFPAKAGIQSGLPPSRENKKAGAVLTPFKPLARRPGRRGGWCRP